MIPNNTHHDTLSIYFDFLEDNNFQTEELRNDLAQPNLVYWCYEFNFNRYGVGGIGYAFDYVYVGNGYCSVGYDDKGVGNYVYSNVGTLYNNVDLVGGRQ